MIRRRTLLLGLFGLVLSSACAGDLPRAEVGVPGGVVEPPEPTAAAPERAIRRDVPLTNVIRGALAAGTRDLTGRPGPNYWQLETDFTIHARLDPETATISGSESIEVHNDSPSELDRIVLRLDHNIFRARVERGSYVPAETTEGMVVTRIAVDGEEVDLEARGRRGPGELGVSGLDRTVAVLWLATPVEPRSGVTLEIEWSTKLPGGETGQGHRMTQRWGETLFQPTQWFPRLAKYDDLRGWDTNPYLGPAEFYNNFGRFDVRIDVPAGWIVSGTGVLQNPEQVLTETARERLSHVLESDDEIMIVDEEEAAREAGTVGGDRLEWHFVAEYVNDFVFATAKDYVWRATRATIPGKGPIPVHMVYLPERAQLFERAGAISRHALEFYSSLWVPYPFPQLTLQDGPSAGMEYPMVINSNQGAADHEVGHQWWPMTVGTNETWYGWMDEGLNTYMNILSDADSAGVPPSLDGQGQAYGGMSGNELEPTMMWVSNYAGPYYGFQAYVKTPMMLSMLGGIVGDDAVREAISAYAETWRFKHPSPWDFVFFLDAALGRDLGWFWYYWLFTTESVDGSIAGVTTSGSRTVVTVRQDGQMPSPIVLAVELAGTGPKGSASSTVTPAAMSTVELRDDGTAIVTWPVDVWFDGSRTFEAELDFGGREIERITLDPGGRFPDRDVTDNVWPRAD